MPFDLAALRKSANLTQAEAAERLGIPRHRLGRLERGIGNLKTFAAAVKSLGGTLPCLRTIRLQTGVSARELARSIGTTHSVVSVMEHEGRGSVTTWLKALDVLANDIPGVALHCGDALDVLRTMPAGIVDTVITSPPYYGQRVYANGHGLGNEATPEDYIAAVLRITAELHRVLKPNGSFWLVIDDTRRGKSLLGIPSRLAHRMCDEQGWRLRSEIAWHASKGLDSADDRVRDAHSTIFWFTKSADAFVDEDALREGNAPPLRPSTVENMRRRILAAVPSEAARTAALAELERRAAVGTDLRLILRGEANGTSAAHHAADLERRGYKFLSYDPRGARLGSVWDIAPEGDAEHPAAFPTALAERCLALTSRPGDVILDPFCGSGTVAVVARRLGRRTLAIDVAPEYIQRTRARLLSG